MQRYELISRYIIRISTYVLYPLPDSYSYCLRYNNEKHGYYDEKFKICAYTEGKTACWGDSGGPFMCEQNDQFILYGAVGGGGDCGLQHFSGYFANVFNHMDFVKKIVGYDDCNDGSDEINCQNNDNLLVKEAP